MDDGACVESHVAVDLHSGDVGEECKFVEGDVFGVGGEFEEVSFGLEGSGDESVLEFEVEGSGRFFLDE